MAKQAYFETQSYPNTLLVGVHAPYNHTNDIDSYFEEFLNLAKTNKVNHNVEFYVKLRQIDPAYFLTKGKRQELKELCQKNDIEQIIISEPLTSQQARNLGDMLECTIFDRTELILDIFEKAAHSTAGKAQVAIAILQHKKSRLAGKGIHFGQQAGAIGVRGGPGETAKERETRHIEQSILQLKKQLKKNQRTRDTQRKRRLDSQVANLCLIGYTNAGKSTLLNTLTKSNVLAEDKLFATLDTTTRALYINGKQKGILSDTVGFIQQLPHKLIEAFKSTLSELQYADLLLHVIDISNPNWELHITVVHNILHELGVDKKILYVFNKSDKIKNGFALTQTLAKYQPYVVTSAQSKNGISPLIEFLDTWKRANSTNKCNTIVI